MFRHSILMSRTGCTSYSDALLFTLRKIAFHIMSSRFGVTQRAARAPQINALTLRNDVILTLF